MITDDNIFDNIYIVIVYGLCVVCDSFVCGLRVVCGAIVCGLCVVCDIANSTMVCVARSAPLAAGPALATSNNILTIYIL